jgi:DNA mismatch repair protein MSH6
LDEDEKPKRTKAKKPAAKASAPKMTQAASSGGGGSFLTAAEQRALEKKDDKKKADSPFAFLQDIRDVRLILTAACSKSLTSKLA